MAIEVGDAVFRIKGDSTALEQTLEKVGTAVEKAARLTSSIAEKALQRTAEAAERAARREIEAAERKAAREISAAERAAAREEAASAKSAAAAERAAAKEISAAERKAAKEAAAADRAAAAQEKALRDRQRAEEKAHRDSIERINKLGTSLSSVGQGFRNVGYVASAAGAGIMGSIGAVTMAAINWESAFTGVRKTVDGTDAELQALGMGIRQLAREIPVSAVELAKFAEIGGQMGIPREALLEFTKTVAILGTTTNIAGEAGAAMLAQFANVAQVPQGQYSNLVASLVALGQAGNATESQIMEMATRLAAAGTQAAMSAGDVMGFANALAGVGLEAEAGGTAFSKLFIDISKATALGGTQLELLAQVAGVSAQEFAAAFQKDPAEAVTSFIMGLGRMQDEGYNLYAVLETLGYTETRLSDAIIRSTLSRDQLTESIKLGNTAFQENNAHTEEARKQWEDTANQLKLLRNNVIELAMSMGGPLLTSVNEVLNAIKPYIDSAIEWIKNNQELTTTILKVGAVLGGLLITLGPVLVGFGSFVGLVASVVTAVAAVATALPALTAAWGTVSTAISAVVSVLPGLAAALGVVKAAVAAVGTGLAALAAFLGWPVGVVVAAIAAIIAAASALWYYWDEVRSGLAAIWSSISSTFWSIFGPIIEAIQAMTGWGIGPGAVTGPQVPGMATGGTVKQSGWAVVGERGPELVQMPQGATVYDADQSRPALTGATNTQAGQIVNHFHFGKDSIRSDNDIRELGRLFTRLIGSGMTANGTRAYV